MGKHKNSGGGTVSEDVLLKALNELEELAKGDALEEADTEGGFSTEGEPLSKKAPSGRGGENTAKSKRREDMAKMMSASDASSDSSDEGSTKKGMGGADESSDDDDEGSADESSDESSDDVSKSFYDDVAATENGAKGLEVSEFLEDFTQAVSERFARLEKAIFRELGDIKKSFSKQDYFNTRMAVGVTAIGKLVQKQSELSKSLAESVDAVGNQPRGDGRGKAVLSKSDVAPSPLDGGGEVEVNSPQGYQLISDWLLQKATAGEISPIHVTMFEQQGVAGLPLELRKSLQRDLQKSAS